MRAFKQQKGERSTKTNDWSYQAVLQTNTTAHWLTVLESNQVPCAPVLTRTQVRQHPQVVANHALVELDHADAGAFARRKPCTIFGHCKYTPHGGAQIRGTQRGIAVDA